MGHTWSKNLWCFLREVLSEGHFQDRVILTEEDIARFFVVDNLDSCCSNIRLLVLNGCHIGVKMDIHRKLVINGGC